MKSYLCKIQVEHSTLKLKIVNISYEFVIITVINNESLLSNSKNFFWN